ncbi:ferredoxin--NADP(+) reductase [Candidatus Nardonella dryophthoridicola]|uniref:ferredoxin--NADP(+) reductase n=1 Tax=Candidatus Nardonella dryophthoridicola TaxID=1971485 RepID=UPI001AD89906|nr:ferredoxin--NADP(+) reductase [Candidatus Nardonella dryophthoridicola]QTJ62791.1 ferredoxin--NADP(+) reductase [Candidatus Nardonella dryophthoridicola]
MWEKCIFIKLIKWSNYLFSIKFKADILKFIPGQFTILRIKIRNNYINRFYSYINSYKSKILELYIHKSGIVSNILYNIDKNNKIFYVTKKSYGNFILPNKKYNTLWMISSGTGIGPYISMLKSDFNKNNNFKYVKILHSIRYIKDFVYLYNIKKIINNYNNIELFIFVTKENIKNHFNKRITYFLKKNNLIKYFGRNINIYNDHIMICGNINIINDVINIIKNKNIDYINKNYKNIFTFEKYY